MKSVSCSMYIFVFLEYSNSIGGPPGPNSRIRECVALNRHHPAPRRNGVAHGIEDDLRAEAVLERRRRALALACGGEEALHERGDGRLADDLHGIALALGQPGGHLDRRGAGSLAAVAQLAAPPAGGFPI